MSAAAQLLGMSMSDLGSALQSGQSLASIASSKGVSQNALVSALSSTIKGSNPNLTTDQASQIATQMANRTSAAQTPSVAGIPQAAASSWTAGTLQTPVSTFELAPDKTSHLHPDQAVATPPIASFVRTQALATPNADRPSPHLSSASHFGSGARRDYGRASRAPMWKWPHRSGALRWDSGSIRVQLPESTARGTRRLTHRLHTRTLGRTY